MKRKNEKNEKNKEKKKKQFFFKIIQYWFWTVFLKSGVGMGGWMDGLIGGWMDGLMSG